MKREKVEEEDVRGRPILDLACEEGYNKRILARKDAKVTRVDFSEEERAFVDSETLTYLCEPLFLPKKHIFCVLYL